MIDIDEDLLNGRLGMRIWWEGRRRGGGAGAGGSGEGENGEEVRGRRWGGENEEGREKVSIYIEGRRGRSWLEMVGDEVTEDEEKEALVLEQE